MMRRIGILVMVLAVGFAIVPAAAAHDAGPMRGAIDGVTTGFNPDPDAVAARCPDGYEWIISTAGAISLESTAYSGSLSYVNEHCSRWVKGPADGPHGRFVGRFGAGEMTMTTPGGDRLEIAYAGVFVVDGDMVTWWTSKVRQTYKVVGGTGVFEGASGGGFMFVTDDTGLVSGEFVGSLRVDG